MKRAVNLAALVLAIGLLVTQTATVSGDDLKPVELTVLYQSTSWDPIRNECGRTLTRTWEELGITVKAEELDYVALSTRIMKEPLDSFSAWIFGLVARPEYLDPDIHLSQRFDSANVGVDGTNFSGFSSAYLDGLIRAQRVEMDRDKRRSEVWAAQDYATQEVPMQPLYHVQNAQAHSVGRFDGWTSMIGYGVYNVWNLLNLTPLTADSTVRFAQVTDIGVSNPLNYNNGLTPDLMRLVYDTLARINTDGVPVRSAAQSWETVSDTEILVHLRPGMRFHDGNPVTARDVAFSYNYFNQWKIPEFYTVAKQVQGVEVIDDLTLKMTLVQPYPAVYQTVFAQIYILPQHIWDGMVEREKLASPLDWSCPNPVGSGPFKWGYWRTGQEVYLEANTDYYWPPKVNFRFMIFKNPEAVFMAVMGGEADFHERRLLPEQIAEARKNAKVEVTIAADFGVYYFGWNTRVLPGRDSLFRKAIAYAVDYDFIVNVVLKGYAYKGASFIAPANKYWSNPFIRLPELNLDTARSLLAAAGYQWNSRGQLCYPSEWELREYRFGDAPQWPGQPSAQE